MQPIYNHQVVVRLSDVKYIVLYKKHNILPTNLRQLFFFSFRDFTNQQFAVAEHFVQEAMMQRNANTRIIMG